MSIKDTLGIVIQKVAQNRVNVNNALLQAQATIVQADEEAVAAAKVLIAKFGNPQGAGQIVTNVYQLEALQDTVNEMDAMMAALQNTVTDEKALEAASAQLAANTEAANSPLSGAGSFDGAFAVDGTGQSSEAASPAA